MKKMKRAIGVLLFVTGLIMAMVASINLGNVLPKEIQTLVGHHIFFIALGIGLVSIGIYEIEEK
jgi:hypothetical protein